MWQYHQFELVSGGHVLVNKQRELDETLGEHGASWLRQIVTSNECRALVKGKPQSFCIITCTSILTCYNYDGMFCSFTHLKKIQITTEI